MNVRLICIFCLLFAMACKSKQVLQKTNEEITSKNEVKIDSAYTKPPKFENSTPEYLNIKARISIREDGDETSFSATIRSKKDSLIWISAQAVLGIEAVRLLLTRDSVFLLNKLDKTYSVYDRTFAREKLGIDLDLTILQQILAVRNFYIPATSYIQYDSILVSKKQDLVQNTFLKKNNLINRASYSVVNSESVVNIELYDYKRNNNYEYPQRISIAKRNETHDNMQIEVQSINFERASSYSFNVPSSYKRL